MLQLFHSPLTIESRLLLACARTDPDARPIRTVIEEGPDWPAFLQAVEQCGLASLTHASLRQIAEVPKATSERLRHLSHRSTVHSAAQRHLLRETLARCVEAGAPVIVMRGAALATTVYPSPTLRSLDTVELLVHEQDPFGVKALLDESRERKPRVRLRHHTGPGLSAHRGAPPIDHVWRRARRVEIESVATLVLSDEDLLVQLALDLATCIAQPDKLAGVQMLCDLGETCRRYHSTVDWNRLATRSDAARPLFHSLRLASDLVGAPVPQAALINLRSRFARLPLEDRLIDAVARRSIFAVDSKAQASVTWRALAAQLLAIRSTHEAARRAWSLGTNSLRTRLRRISASADPSTGTALDSVSRDRVPTARTPLTRHAAAGEVAVTHDPSSSDGVGSQLLRIYGLYALSRALQTKYVHTGLLKVEYQGFVPLLTRRNDPNFVARYNAFFSLPSDDFDLDSCERVRIHNLTESDVEQHRQQAAVTGRPILLEATHHYGYTNAHPAAFDALRAVSPYRAHRATGPIRVCIHVRRGDNSVPGRHDGRDRLLPNQYYLRVCSAVIDALRREEVPFVIRLHTEVPPRRYTLYPDTPGLFFTLNEPATVDPSEYVLDDFDTLPNLEKVINVEAREAIDDFATADVLILSLSALGYFGGLLNPHGLVIWAPWWHPPLSSWLVADEHGNLDRSQVAARIADYLRDRKS